MWHTVGRNQTGTTRHGEMDASWLEIQDEAGNTIAGFDDGDADKAEQIVREHNGYEAMKEGCKKALEALRDAQGEWTIVSALYAPEWTHGLKDAADALEELIGEAVGEG